MKKLPYTVIMLNSNTITGSIQLKATQPITGQQLKSIVCQQHHMDWKQFKLYWQDNEQETEIGDTMALPKDIETIQLREKIPAVVLQQSGMRKRRPTSNDPDSIVFEQSSNIGDEEREFMESEPEQSPFVYGEVKVCRWLKCFSYEMFLELNPEIGVVNFYGNKKDCPKRPKLTIPFLQIQKIVRLKDSPCFSRKSYMRLVLPDDTVSICFYDKSVCVRWMKYLKQAIIFAKYFEARTLLLTNKLPQMSDTLKHTNTSRVELHDSITSSHSVHRSESSQRSEESGHEIYINEKRDIVLLEDFDVDKKIGNGSFGYVFLAKHKLTGKQFALKQLSKNQLIQKHQLKYALTQLQILKASQHPFILKLFYAFQTKEYLYMALTYCSHGNLKQMIIENGKLSVEDALIYICEVILAIEYLHDNNILYRDLKPQNILIGHDYHLLLTDFSLSKTQVGMNDITDSFCGSPLYVSPEMIVKGTATHMSDIYGIGVVFYQMVHGHTLFETVDLRQAFELIKTEQPNIDSELPAQVKDFLRCTLDKRPYKRPKRIRDHPLFDDVNWKHVMSKKHHPNVQFVKEGSDLQWVQTDTKIDIDYNHINYLQNRVEGWFFSTNTSVGQ